MVVLIEDDIQACSLISQVTTGRGEVGVIVGSFGKSGKLRVEFSGGLSPSPGRSAQDGVVVLRCKRYMYQANSKRLLQ